MGTYLTLDSMKTKICGLKIRVRPCPSSDPNISLSPTQGFQASGKKGRDPGTPSLSLESTMPSPPGNLEGSTTPPLGCVGERMTFHPASVDASTTPPLPSREYRTAILSPVLQRDPRRL